MTDVTGVAIPPDFSSRYQEVSLLTGGFPRQCAHWLGMTVLLFVQFFFSETAPFHIKPVLVIRIADNGIIYCVTIEEADFWAAIFNPIFFP